MVDHRRGRFPASLAGIPLVIERDGSPLAGDIQNILVGELVAVAVQQVERRAAVPGNNFPFPPPESLFSSLKR